MNEIAWEDLARTLSLMLSEDELTTALETRRLFSSDLFSQGALCAAVARPQTPAALAKTIKATIDAGFSIVPRGGGMSHTGGSLPLDERSLAIDTAGLNQIVSMSEADMVVTVQAGATWKQVYEALAPQGLRLPFFGPYSGSRATIGGSLSTGATYLGGARYGSAADNVLAITVALADGSLLATGQSGLTNARTPVYRSFGPDLSGLFLHDQGALGVKTSASLRLIRMPAHTGFLSFGVKDAQTAARALIEIARTGAAEDAYAVQSSVARQRLLERTLRSDLGVLARVASGDPNPLRAALSAAQLILAGGRFLGDEGFLLNLVCAARTRAALGGDLLACRQVAASLGLREVPSTAPRVNRATPFPPIAMALGDGGGRWAAVNAKIAFSEAQDLIAAGQALLDRHRAEMQRLKVAAALQLYVIGNQVFHFECVLSWRDAWLPLHRWGAQFENAPPPEEPAAEPEGRALATGIRLELMDLFRQHGAASNQLGKAYPYLRALRPETRALLIGLKRQLDPTGRMNPGALGLFPKTASVGVD